MLTVALCCAPWPAAADVVHLTTGRAIEGIIVQTGETVLKLETAKGILGIPLANVESIDYASERENQALQQQWAVVARQEERDRAARRAARRARQEAELASGVGTVEVDGERLTQAEASRRAASEARRLEQDRRRVDAFRRQQAQVDEAERASGALIFQGVAAHTTSAGMAVRAELLNVSPVAHRNIRIEAQLVAAAGTEEERIVSRRTIILPELGPDRIHVFDIAFSIQPSEPVVPRLTVADSRPAS